MANNKFVTLMHAKGYSIRGLAKKLGLHFSYLSHMANGRRMPTLQRAMKIAKALDISAEELFKTLPKQPKVRHG